MTQTKLLEKYFPNSSNYEWNEIPRCIKEYRLGVIGYLLPKQNPREHWQWRAIAIVVYFHASSGKYDMSTRYDKAYIKVHDAYHQMDEACKNEVKSREAEIKARSKMAVQLENDLDAIRDYETDLDEII